MGPITERALATTSCNKIAVKDKSSKRQVDHRPVDENVSTRFQ